MASSDEGSVRWPAVTYEPHSWHPDSQGASRNSLRQHSGPYQAAVVPCVADAAVTSDSETQALVEEAASVLARVDGDLTRARILPLPAVLLRTESASSSQIEHLTSSAKSLALADIGESKGDNARLVVANVRAMENAVTRVGPVTVASLLDVHALLIGPDPGHQPGLRAEQVWIGGKALGPHRADFVPPHHSRVTRALDDLVEFAARDDLPVLSQVAIAHAQFETIHPFTDGNGRSGRALIHMMLRRAGLVRGATIPISAGLLHDAEGYVRALDAYRLGDPAPIVRALAEATIFSADLARELVANILRVQADWRGRLTARSDSVVWVMVEQLPGAPVVTAEFVQRAYGVSAPTAYAAIDRLVDVGALEPQSQNRRNRVWLAPEILAALEKFADAARRAS